MTAVLYAIASILADGLLSAASRHPEQHTLALKQLTTAGAIFPFDRRFRKGPAVYLSLKRWKGSVPLAIAAHERVLLTDPWSMDMHRNLAGLYYEAGDHERAAYELAVLDHFLPGRQISIMVNANPATN